MKTIFRESIAIANEYDANAGWWSSGIEQRNVRSHHAPNTMLPLFSSSYFFADSLCVACVFFAVFMKHQINCWGKCWTSLLFSFASVTEQTLSLSSLLTPILYYYSLIRRSSVQWIRFNTAFLLQFNLYDCYCWCCWCWCLCCCGL